MMPAAARPVEPPWRPGEPRRAGIGPGSARAKPGFAEATPGASGLASGEGARMASEQDEMERIVALAKRRGFIFPGSEIYGGLNGFWDYGPLGVELKRNIKDAWWHDCVTTRDDMVGVDAAIIMNPKVWEASGHLAGFTDPLVEDAETKQRFRADHLQCVFFLAPTPDMKVGESYLVVSSAPPPESIPQHTIVASSPQEAVSALMGDKNLRKRLGLRGVRSGCMLGGGLGQPNYATVWVDTDSGPQYLYTRSGTRDFIQKSIREIPSPFTGKIGVLTEPREFNLMFRTFVGAMQDSSSEAYLRPETAQGIFTNYKNVLDTSRLKVPFGIAQIGKAFRNEINPRNYTFRSREFEQMEIEFFCHPSEADKWYATWRQARFDWYVGLGLKSDRLRLRDHEKDELAHYAKACADIEYAFPFGTAELEGVANRTDFDLKQHQNHPACIVKDLSYFDDETKERFLPYVIEPSGGVDRALLAFLCEAYDEDEAPDEKGNPQKRTVLRFHPRLAPIKVAVFPLVKKDGMPQIARAIYEECRRHLAAFYDEKGAVGRRYRRQDEAGTPFCVTVDGQTFEDGTVTIRDRDTMKQERIPGDGVLEYVREHLHI
jgi:glycyl-tRNA synthetase